MAFDPAWLERFAAAGMHPAESPTPTTPKPSKYRNTRVTIAGVTWDSRREYQRWLVLWSRKEAGLITDLRRQVRFPLHALGGAKVCSYVADFTYRESGRLVVEDVKGLRLPMYLLKRRWMAAEHGIEIREV